LPREHTVICTAGHIDHGKSSLIECLTGEHPDVLREEKEREMTIELGFVFYGDEVTFIDVPGHEKFLKTMLAGASEVDGAILVIAADDGVMPQTREHFEILQLMGTQQGIIALTKIDLVEKEWIELVKEDIKELTNGTFLVNAPILPLSNRTGQGIDEFKAALAKLVEKAPKRQDRGLFRMWLDRAFSIKGSGTVVAGTVLSGSAKVGSRVEILPAGITARIKRIQVHKKDQTSCAIGERAALNIPGIDKEQVRRGDLLATPEHYRPSYMLNVRFHLLSSAVKPVENRLRIRLHIGSSEIIGRIILLEEQPIPPGGSALIQLRLENQAIADIGDRFVVRSFSEGRVLGGGIVLETHPRKMRLADLKNIQRLKRLETAEPREIVRQYLDRIQILAADAETIAHETAFLTSDIIDILGAMHRDGEVKVIDPAPKWSVMLMSRFEELKTLIVKHLDDFHKQQPNLQGVRRSELKSHYLVRAAQNVLESVLIDLTDDGIIEVSGEIVCRKGFQIAFSPEQEQLLEKIIVEYTENLFNPPNPEDLPTHIDTKWEVIKPIFTGMIELGILVKLFTPDAKPIYYHRYAIVKARQQLLEFFEEHDEMKFFEFRELIGSTRKFTTPLLMLFDDEGLTIRDGDVRKLRRSNHREK